MRCPALLLLIVSTAVSLRGQDTSRAKALDVFAGEWQGTATAFFPREEGRPDREETVTCICTKVLKETYLECRSTWTSTKGDVRHLLIFWNYDTKKDSFYILFLYDDWPGKVHYPLAYDERERMFTGLDTFRTSGGVPAEERVAWKISPDGNTIEGTEHNHYATDPEHYWAQSFKFVWHRK